MTVATPLHGYLTAASAAPAARRGRRRAWSGRSIRLSATSTRSPIACATGCAQWACGPGDRVGIYVHKSIDAVAAIFGILKAGAAYVPVDPLRAAGAQRLHPAQLRGEGARSIEARFAERFRRRAREARARRPRCFVLDDVGGRRSDCARRSIALDGAAARARGRRDAATARRRDLAYILYTSGSTGKPKGRHALARNAVSFVDWCSEVLRAERRATASRPMPRSTSTSRSSTSTCRLKHGATLVLVAEDIGKDPQRLRRLIAGRANHRSGTRRRRSSRLLAQYGHLDQPRLLRAAPRAVRRRGVSGEAPAHACRAVVPDAAYFNLYGPTETNVCTFYEVLLPHSRRSAPYPFPIGTTCSHLECTVVDGDGRGRAGRGRRRARASTGRGVMQGYWALPEQTERAFLVDRRRGSRWYRPATSSSRRPTATTPIVGRRDRMVKRRGYRVELGEIEAGLYRHPLRQGSGGRRVARRGSGVKVKAFLSCREEKRPSLIEMKRFCAEQPCRST